MRCVSDYVNEMGAVARRVRHTHTDGRPLSTGTAKIRYDRSEDGTAADSYAEGYACGKAALPGDDLPHPSNNPHPEMFWHGMRAALHPRGLQPSLFLRTVPLDR